MRTDSLQGRLDAAEMKARAVGRWMEIVTRVGGVDASLLDGRGHPCPKCGGTNRFSVFKDFEETGGCICRHCHAAQNSDGFATVAWLLDCGFPEALRIVAEFLGMDTAGSAATASCSQASATRRPDKPQPAPANSKTFPTANAAVEALERQLGKRSHAWTYRDASGEPVGVVLRFDRPGKKEIRPIARAADGWTIGAMAEPRPLYNLPTLANANEVLILEGEKCAEAAVALGFVATTSSGGANAAGKTDWSPLAGKKVVVIPDAGGPGERYLADVLKQLVCLNPAPEVRVVRLPGLADGEDIVEWIERGGTADQLRERIDAEPIVELRTAEGPVAPIEQFQPFPVEALPEPVCSFVSAGAAAIGCDPSFIALPLLTAIGSAIGTTRTVRLKHGWFVSPILWTVIVGYSGTSKTPGFKLALKAARSRQRKAMQRHAEVMQEYEIELAKWEKDFATWKRSKAGGDPPPKPEAPCAEQWIVSDTTVEALAPLLQANPRGLLLARDELSGWLGSFDRYAGGKGVDAAHWLSMHNGESIIVNRKTGKTIFVPHAAVSITGAIQPGILARALGAEHRESGLAARLLLAYPPRQPKRWTEADIDAELERQIADLLDRLYSLAPEQHEEGERPVSLTLTAEAKQIGSFTRWRAGSIDEKAQPLVV